MGRSFCASMLAIATLATPALAADPLLDPPLAQRA